MALVVVAMANGSASLAPIEFSAVQADLFAAPGALASAWADVDMNGTLDLAVSFESGEIRLYRNDGRQFESVGRQFESVGRSWGLPLSGPVVRGLSWGDYDRDGDPDLYAGVQSGPEPQQNLLFRNDALRAFSDVAVSMGVEVRGGDSRQAAWIDYDSDGDLDLFVAQRWSYNRMFRNDGVRFVDVSRETNLIDPRRSVGACWFDMDQDGDLDVFITNQQGDKDAMYRNDAGVFVDVAAKLGMDQPHRSIEEGGVGCTVSDFDNDGLIDLFVATYGRGLLYRNLGSGHFREVSSESGIVGDKHAVSAAWGDVNNDGAVDLYVAAYERRQDQSLPQDLLYANRNGHFVDVLTPGHVLHAADHGAQWADFDRDGDLDLALTQSYLPTSRHPLLRNELQLPARTQSLQISVVDSDGRATCNGAVVKVFAPDGRLLGARIVPTGDGYASQSAVPVHIGVGTAHDVTVEVTFATRHGSKVQRAKHIDPRRWVRKVFVMKVEKE